MWHFFFPFVESTASCVISLLETDLTQAGEIVVVEDGAGSRGASTAAAARSAAARSTAAGGPAGSTVAAGGTATATGGAATTLAAAEVAAEAATAAAALAGRLLPGAVPLDNVLLGLLLLLLAALLDGGGVVAEVLLLDGDQGLLLLGALVGLAELLGGVEAGVGAVDLELGQVLVEGELLGLGLLGLGLGVLGLGGLLLALGDGLAGLLVLQLGVAVGSAPGLGSLLLGTAVVRVSQISTSERMGWDTTYGAMFLACRSSALRWRVAP